MVRQTSISSVAYSPGIVPEDPAALPRFLGEEFRQLAAAIQALAMGHLDKTYVAPAKPRDGDIRYADGVQWDPGAGLGIYYFNGTDWVLLG